MTIKKILQSLTLVALLAGCTHSVNSQSGTQPPKVQNIDQAKFTEMAKDSNTFILDVRTPGEVSEGYIPGTKYFIDINGASFESQISALDTTKTYLVYCRCGARSGRASEYMVNHGFKNVCNLNGGILNWTGPVKRD